MENVPNILSDKNRKDFFVWCEFLESLGYTNKYSILNAKDYGIPQNRKRLFMLSWLGEDYHYEFPSKQPLINTLQNVLENKVDDKYYLSNEVLMNLNIDINSSISKTIRVGGRNSFDNSHCWDIIVEDFYANRKHREYKEVAPTLRSERVGLKGFEPMVWDGFNQSIRKDSSCVGTLTRNCGADLKRNGQGIIQYSRPHGFNKGGISESEVFPAVRCSSTKDGNNGIIDGISIRKLTPKECWRLMGFDDSDFEKSRQALIDAFYNGKDKANSQLYKQAGNSIVVPVLEAIFKQM